MSNARKPERARTVSLVAATILAAFVIFVAGVDTGFRITTGFGVWGIGSSIARSTVADMQSALGAEPVYFLQPARGPGAGVTVNDIDDGRLVMIAGFFDGSNGIRLMRRDGSIVAAWSLSYTALFPERSHLLDIAPQTDWNTDLHGTVLNPDGSAVTNFDYAGAVKLDRCGGTEWALNAPAHHSVERSETGGYWIGGMRFLDPANMADTFPPLTSQKDVPYFRDDQIMKVAEDGRILDSRSVTRILYDSGLEPLLTANGFSFYPNGHWNKELVHLNKIAELPAALAPAFPEFAAGDLMISLREHNLIAVIDPATWRVKWHQTGPWKRQHDPEFAPDGTISVFNNNTYRLNLGEFDRSDPNSPKVSTILRVDPRTGEARKVYGGAPGQEFLTTIRGKHEIEPDGGMMITEFEGGRAFQVDASGRIVWEFINRYSGAFVAEITEARVYDPSYFTVTDWSCPGS
ncbi:MAG: hypothetical protein KDE08_10555 [Rhodobacteraceae bacterium]|nr:hypothetical protein [Paracoccaceae bacterium]